jgi:hypothetical protein
VKCTHRRKELDAVTNQQAIRVVQEIVRENRENGELEGILNRYRVAALNRLIRTTTTGMLVNPKPTPPSSAKPKLTEPERSS